MSLSHYLVISGAAIGAFLVGAAWYSPLLFGNTYLALRGLDPAVPVAMPVSEILLEFARWLIVVCVMALLARWIGIDSLGQGLLLGLVMWIAIYAALAGAVLHEGQSLRVYAIHVGDGLCKLLLIGGVLSFATWRS